MSRFEESEHNIAMGGQEEVLDDADRVEFERLSRVLGAPRLLRIEHLVFSRFVLKDLPFGSPLYWWSVLDEMREAVREELTL